MDCQQCQKLEASAGRAIALRIALKETARRLHSELDHMGPYKACDREPCKSNRVLTDAPA